MLHWRLIDQRLALLANAVCAIIVALDTNTGRFTALWAYQHNVRDVERGLKLDAARVNRATLSLNLTLVFGMNVHALHNHPVLIRQNLDHFAALTLFFDFSADDFNGIAFTDLDSHRSLLNWPRALPGPAKQSS
jgi:hypothetical protein